MRITWELWSEKGKTCGCANGAGSDGMGAEKGDLRLFAPALSAGLRERRRTGHGRNGCGPQSDSGIGNRQKPVYQLQVLMFLRGPVIPCNKLGGALDQGLPHFPMPDQIQPII